MLQRTPTELPTFHFVSFDMVRGFENRRACGFYELSMEQSTHRTTLVRCIAGNEFNDLDRVYEASDGMFRDVTEDIARQVLSVVCEDSEVPWELRDWLENQLGCRAVEETLAEEMVEVR